MDESPSRLSADEENALIAWLLDSDPAIRWQVMQDLLHAAPEEVKRERARLTREGWAARLLAMQAPDGHWGGDTFIYQQWTGTSDVLNLLTLLGLDPTAEPAMRMIERVKKHVTWGPEFNNNPYFEGEVEACINGRALAVGGYFRQPCDKLAQRLLSEQLDDGGWNCYAPPSKRSSFHSTLCVLEGLLAYQHFRGASEQLTHAMQRGEEYLLSRRLLRTASTGNIINLQWTMPAFPCYWHYDILRALDYFRSAGRKPDERMSEAYRLIKSKQKHGGQWLLETVHPGDVPIQMEQGKGTPSRWLTLKALRVVDWYENAGGAANAN